MIQHQDIIDCHVHFESLGVYEKLMADMKGNGVGEFCVLVLGRDSKEPDCNKLPHALWLKRRHPNRAYVFGGLDFTGIIEGGHAPEVPFVEQLKSFIALGCDGLKLITGKPDRRKQLAQPLDSDIYKPMLNLLQETGFPLLWHVGDPPEFWSEHTVPVWARRQGWWYDKTHPSLQQIRDEITRVISNYPGLNLTLPHFFFLSDALDDASKLLENNQNLFLDLAPGIEMFHHFTLNRDATRDFFVRYSDRILYGSDAGLMSHATSAARGTMIQRFLSTSDAILIPDDPFMWCDEPQYLHGLDLPISVCSMIKAVNFKRFVRRNSPCPLNTDLARTMLADLQHSARHRGEPESTPTFVLERWSNDHNG